MFTWLLTSVATEREEAPLFGSLAGHWIAGLESPLAPRAHGGLLEGAIGDCGWAQRLNAMRAPAAQLIRWDDLCTAYLVWLHPPPTNLEVPGQLEALTCPGLVPAAQHTNRSLFFFHAFTASGENMPAICVNVGQRKCGSRAASNAFCDRPPNLCVRIEVAGQMAGWAGRGSRLKLDGHDRRQTRQPYHHPMPSVQHIQHNVVSCTSWPVSSPIRPCSCHLQRFASRISGLAVGCPG